MEQQLSARARFIEDRREANSDIMEQELIRRKDFLEFSDDGVTNLTKSKTAHPRHIDVGQNQNERPVACIGDALKRHGPISAAG